jgi:hypothetical protein
MPGPNGMPGSRHFVVVVGCHKQSIII